MNRKLFIVVWSPSLLMIMITAGMWARSYWIYDGISWRWENVLAGIQSKAGRISLNWTGDMPVPGGYGRRSFSLGTQPHFSDLWDFRLEHFMVWAGANPPYKALTNHVLTMPYWFPLLPWILSIGIMQLRRRRRHRHLAMGLCLRCGYDLRATPDRCPECGMVPDKPADLSI